MAPRPFWKGYLKLSLVTCPVAMTPATSEAEKLRFNTVNAKTGNPTLSRYVDEKTGKEVPDKDQVKGYPKGEDEYVLLEDAEIESVALDSTHTISIDRFVPSENVGWVWLDTPHYLLPDDKVAEEAYAVIRAAMEATGTYGLSRLVLYRRERPVLLVPKGKGIMLWTLRYGDEVRDPGDYFEQKPETPDSDLLKMITKLIDTRKTDWTPEIVHDPVQARLLEMIEAKRKPARKTRKPASPPSEPEEEGKVIDIMDALKRSLSGGKKR